MTTASRDAPPDGGGTITDAGGVTARCPPTASDGFEGRGVKCSPRAEIGGVLRHESDQSDSAYSAWADLSRLLDQRGIGRPSSAMSCLSVGTPEART